MPDTCVKSKLLYTSIHQNMEGLDCNTAVLKQCCYLTTRSYLTLSILTYFCWIIVNVGRVCDIVVCRISSSCYYLFCIYVTWRVVCVDAKFIHSHAGVISRSECLGYKLMTILCHNFIPEGWSFSACNVTDHCILTPQLYHCWDLDNSNFVCTQC